MACGNLPNLDNREPEFLDLIMDSFQNRSHGIRIAPMGGDIDGKDMGDTYDFDREILEGITDIDGNFALVELSVVPPDDCENLDFVECPVLFERVGNTLIRHT